MTTKNHVSMWVHWTRCTEDREKASSLEDQIHASNIALLKILDPEQETLDWDIELLESNTWKISLEEALDSVQSKEWIEWRDEIRKFRWDLKSRVISTLKDLWLMKSHIEWKKQQWTCNRKVIVDDTLVVAVKENNL